MRNLNLAKGVINTPTLTFLFPWVGINRLNFHKGKINKSLYTPMYVSGGMQRFSKSLGADQRLPDEQGEQTENMASGT